MSPLDRAVLAERAAAIRRHLARVAEKLPASAAELAASSDASDAVILHLWQATQIVIDLAVSACVAHAYENLDLARVHIAAASGPADLLAFVAALDRISRPS